MTRGWALALLLIAACSPTKAPPPPPPSVEAQVRTRLGIPPEAKSVIVFGQAAHLDIDWQKTFDGYYQAYVQDVFLEARGVLDAQPRAFYSVAEMGFLQHHLQLHPEEVAAWKAHAARGAVRIVGGGMTSPDTVLPETELLFRDFFYGGRFSEDVLGVRPTAAWLPDSFGIGATTPDVLAAAGFSSVAFSRIDGAPGVVQILQHPPNGPPPAPGSTAETLRTQGSADFVWRGPGGGTVLARWLASNLYCMGDDLDYQNDVFQVPGGHLGSFSDDPVFTDHQVNKYVNALAGVTKTPYRYVPVGCDFQHPKPELLSYLDGYNQRQYPKTGVWAVAAGFDDYATLVGAHAAELPTLTTDLTPYFMGFYATRPEVKRRTREAALPFFTAEIFAVALGDAGTATMAAAAPALSKLTLADHHDFITGTANDLVASSEQLPLLDEAEDGGRRALAEVTAGIAQRVPLTAGATARVIAFNPAGVTRSAQVELAVPQVSSTMHASIGTRVVPFEILDGGSVRLALSGLPPFGWSAVDFFPGVQPADGGVSLGLLDSAGQPATGASVSRVVLANARVRAQWDRTAVFALSSLKLDGVEALGGDSFTLTDYSDQGGLWRLGHEMEGCAFTAQPPVGTGEQLTVLDDSPLRARVAFSLAGAVREARLDDGDDGLQLALTTAAAQATTRTIGFQFASGPAPALRTSQAGGIVDRAPTHVFTPTFWPAVDFASSGEWAVLLRQSTGVRLGADGSMELLTARDARSEQCDVEGGTGSDPDIHRFEWRVTRAANAAESARAAQAFNRPVQVVAAVANGAGLAAEESLLQVEGAGVVSAIKPAERGEGVIVRVLLLPGPVTLHLGPKLVGRTLVQTDALEHDVKELGAPSDTVILDRDHFGSIATLRLR